MTPSMEDEVEMRLQRTGRCYDLKWHGGVDEEWSCDVSILSLTGYRIPPLGSVNQCTSGKV